jgi:hypothetical protein
MALSAIASDGLHPPRLKIETADQVILCIGNIEEVVGQSLPMGCAKGRLLKRSVSGPGLTRTGEVEHVTPKISDDDPMVSRIGNDETLRFGIG